MLRQNKIAEVLRTEGLSDKLLASMIYLDSAIRNGDIDDRELLLRFILSRYATGLKKIVGEQNNVLDEYYAVGLETFAENEKAAALASNRFERVLLHVYKKIISALATLFTQSDQAWEIGNEAAAEIIAQQRVKGDFRRIMSNADRIAVAHGTAFIWVQYWGNNLHYQAVPMQSVRIGYGEKVVDNTGTERYAHKDELEDATIVCVEREKTGEESTWACYVGESELYPNGRYAVISGKDPESFATEQQGEVATLDEYLDKGGNIANPLTLAKKAGLIDVEYPLAIIRGSENLDSGTLMNVSGLSLFDDCLEIDCAYSRIMTSALESARGIRTLTNEQGATPPPSLSGDVVVKRGQMLNVLGRSGSEVAQALQVLTSLVRTLAESWNVPGYMVVADDPGDPSSGYALALRSQPLVENRQSRINLNSDAVDRLWRIEKALINLHGPYSIPQETDQIWDPGTIRIPVDKAALVAEIKAAKELGILDYLGAIKAYYEVKTDAEAIQIAERIADNDGAHPWPKGAAPEPGIGGGGLFGGGL
jgi:hypothetical protein